MTSTTAPTKYPVTDLETIILDTVAPLSPQYAPPEDPLKFDLRAITTAEGGRFTNVPRTVAQHSGGRYGWGPGETSSGHELALNYLSLIFSICAGDDGPVACKSGTSSDFAWNHHLSFHQRFLTQDSPTVTVLYAQAIKWARSIGASDEYITKVLRRAKAVVPEVTEA
mgnify:CR=1 FL=1